MVHAPSRPVCSFMCGFDSWIIAHSACAQHYKCYTFINCWSFGYRRQTVTQRLFHWYSFYPTPCSAQIVLASVSFDVHSAVYSLLLSKEYTESLQRPSKDSLLSLTSLRVKMTSVAIASRWQCQWPNLHR